ESRWTVGREALREIVEVAAVAGALMTVLAWHGLVDFSATRARSFVAVTALCAIAPVIVRLLATERWLRERHERQAAALVDEASPPDEPHGECLIRARDGVLELDADALRYVRAEANYVDVVFRRDGVRSHRLLRVAIADVERQFAAGVVVRCHRSYLVATAAIARVHGNAQGYRLALRDLTETVPVARSRAKAVLALVARRREAAATAAALPDDEATEAPATDDAS
ncbi:MAG TPA: LytTR family DNA-binding domain-containing protein, partial [Tahibacter sp.]|nr:LytTR family DNA-binding domain-containing protein [Tahibacter sp.]